MRTINRNIVGAFIFSKDEKLLLGKSIKGGVYKGLWIVPGGGVEEGETKLQALRREILEETGIDIETGKIEEMSGALSGQSEKTLRGAGERVIVNMTFYNFKVSLPLDADEVVLRTDDDFQEAAWFSISELDKLEMSPPTATSLQTLGYLAKST